MTILQLHNMLEELKMLRDRQKTLKARVSQGLSRDEEVEMHRNEMRIKEIEATKVGSIV